MNTLNPEKQITISSEVKGTHPILEKAYKNIAIEVQLRVALATPPTPLHTFEDDACDLESLSKQDEREISLPSTKNRPSPEDLRKLPIFSSPSELRSKAASEMLRSLSRVNVLHSTSLQRASSAPETQSHFIPPMVTNTAKLTPTP